MSEVMAIQLISRPVSYMGNVDRLLLVYSESGNVVDVLTIDYGNIPEPYRHFTRLPDMCLTAREFGEWKLLQRNRKTG